MTAVESLSSCRLAFYGTARYSPFHDGVLPKYLRPWHLFRLSRTFILSFNYADLRGNTLPLSYSAPSVCAGV
jgi:hypothetical protein